MVGCEVKPHNIIQLRKSCIDRSYAVGPKKAVFANAQAAALLV